MAMVRSPIVGVALALLTSGVNAEVGSDQTAPSLEQVANMIIAAVVKSDEASLCPLSIYWKDFRPYEHGLAIRSHESRQRQNHIL